MEVVVFSDVFAECQQCVREKAMILVNGRVAREAGEARLVADSLMLLEEAVTSLATSVHLHLNVEGLSAQPLRELQQLLSGQSGSCPICLHFHIGQRAEVVQELPSAWGVRPTMEFRTALAKRFGNDCLEIHYGRVAQRMEP